MKKLEIACYIILIICFVGICLFFLTACETDSSSTSKQINQEPYYITFTFRYEDGHIEQFQAKNNCPFTSSFDEAERIYTHDGPWYFIYKYDCWHIHGTVYEKTVEEVEWQLTELIQLTRDVEFYHKAEEVENIK